MPGKRRQRVGRTDGLAAFEAIVAITGGTLLGVVGWDALRAYGDTATARRAALRVAADVDLARALAIQRRERVALVIDERSRTYVIRSSGGSALVRRHLGEGTEFALTSLVADAPGDSLTFDSSGRSPGAPVGLALERGSGRSHVRVDARGRASAN